MADISTLNVFLHGQAIGTLTYLGGERTLFAFNEEYIADPERSTLGLRFKDRFGELITEFRPYRIKLMPFFSNLLPEGHLRKYLAENAGIHTDREFFLLWALGRDLPGAITVRPAEGEAQPPAEQLDALDEQTRSSAKAEALHFSLAGVQLKFSAVTEASGGLTIPASGVGGNWIVKLPSQQYHGVPENEFSMMTLARMIGITVPTIDLINIKSIGNMPGGIDALGEKAFIIERFDRSSDAPIHIEDFAQVFDVYAEDKYKRASARNIASVIAAEAGDSDIAEFIRRLTFNTLIGNGDMHLKNWSLIYPDRHHARLSPAYDFVSTIPYIADDKAALNFSRSRAFTDYTKDELFHLSAKAALPRKLVLDTALETVDLFMERWQAEKKHFPMGTDVLRAIDAHLKTLSIVQGGE
nr:type II toxin-antitoxin system HipA family toxin [Pelagibius sp. Alg239-R121]